MRIKVLEVGEVKKNKTFFEFPLKYESDGKVQEKKMFSFNEASYKILRDAKENEFYEVVLKKDANGYWQWSEVTQTVAGAPAVANSGGGNRGFETSEERSRRQVLIVRQSCLAQSVASGTVGSSVEDIVNRAGEFEKWVNRE